MHRLFLIFLLLFQSFFLYANAQNISYDAQHIDKQIEYISEQTTPQKRFYIDFENYENLVIGLNSKTESIFAYKDSYNIDGIFIGFFNSDFKNNSVNNYISYNYIYPKSQNISTYLKNEIYTRAP